MNHLKFLTLSVPLLLASIAQDSGARGWREPQRVWFPGDDRTVLREKLTGIDRGQSETRLPSNAWHGLVPLKSTRAEVERLLGPPKGLLAGNYSYETKKEKVRVVYSEGSCKRSLEGQWKVPVDTVLSVTVFPQTTVLVNTLGLDKTIYKRNQEVHPENWAWYASAETGVMIHTMQNNGCEEVMSITYRPTTKDEELRCLTNNAKMTFKKP
ncbi:MAG: hypothetical protein ACREBG_03895 [Pyrinomonadaceae bacterium]